MNTSTTRVGVALAIGIVATPTSISAQQIDDIRTIGVYLGSCVEKKLAGRRFGMRREVTFGFALRRDGSMIGDPQRRFSAPPADQKPQQEFIAAVKTALVACTPLPLSPALGGAIAGRRHFHRYIYQHGQETRI
jgi:hypothetical protein